MKLLNLEPEYFSKDAQSLLKKHFQYVERKYTRFQLIDEIHNFNIIICRLSINFDKSLLRKAINLKCIATTTTGLNHIDLEYCKKNNIEIISLKNEKKFLKNVYSSSEHTWALLMAIYKRIPDSFNDVLNGNWNRNKFINFDLFGRNIGIIGFGRNGKKIAKYAESFGMKIFYFDKFNIISKKNYTQENKITEIFKKCEIIIITITYDETTHSLIDKNLFKLCKYKPILINTSRGEVINEKDLVNALKVNLISGYATDVLTNELDNNKLKNNTILDAAVSNKYNIIITPHIGGANFDSWGKTELFISKKIIKYFYQNA